MYSEMSLFIIKEPVGPGAPLSRDGISRSFRSYANYRGARRRLLDHPEGAGGDPGLALIRCFAGAGVPSGLVNLV